MLSPLSTTGRLRPSKWDLQSLSYHPSQGLVPHPCVQTERASLHGEWAPKFHFCARDKYWPNTRGPIDCPGLLPDTHPQKVWISPMLDTQPSAWSPWAPTCSGLLFLCFSPSQYLPNYSWLLQLCYLVQGVQFSVKLWLSASASINHWMKALGCHIW